MSAVADGNEVHEPIQVLIALHAGLDAMDFIGPLEVMTHALHHIGDPGRIMQFSFLGNRR